MVTNRVEQSGILVLDLSEVITVEPIVKIAIKDFLDQNQILREKSYRQQLKEKDWSVYENKNVVIVPLNDAIIPHWAYMLLTSYTSAFAKRLVVGDEAKMNEQFIDEGIARLNLDEFKDKRVVLKGCGSEYINEVAYANATKKLLPVVRSLMYGEPCSTVPVYKKVNQSL